MSIEHVVREEELVIYREANTIKSNKGFSTPIYTINGEEYFDMNGIRNVIRGYSSGNKVIFAGAGAVVVTSDSSEHSTTEQNKAELRKGLLARAELLGLEFPKNITTANLETLVVSAEKEKEESEKSKEEK